MIYFDNAATTKIFEECTEIVTKYNSQYFFNPSARYKRATEIFSMIKDARSNISKILDINTQELYFTASGTESDNTAIKGVLKKNIGKILIGAGEHAAVYNTAQYAKNLGYDVELIPVNRYGAIDVDILDTMLDANVSFVSIMHVNNETGAINDMKNIVSLVKSRSNAIVHSDGVQAFGKIPVDLLDIGVDMYSISGHKIHAPKGIAGLYVKKGIKLNPLMIGGGQENGLRSGTENVSGILAFAKASEIMSRTLKDRFAHVSSIKQLIKSYFKSLDDVIINDSESSSPYILNVSILGVRGEVLLHSLESEDIMISNGSACSSKKGISRLPAAMGLSKEAAEGTIRLSFAEDNTIHEAELFINVVDKYIKSLRKYRRK